MRRNHAKRKKREERGIYATPMTKNRIAVPVAIASTVPIFTFIPVLPKPMTKSSTFFILYPKSDLIVSFNAILRIQALRIPIVQ